MVADHEIAEGKFQRVGTGLVAVWAPAGRQRRLVVVENKAGYEAIEESRRGQRDTDIQQILVDKNVHISQRRVRINAALKR